MKHAWDLYIGDSDNPMMSLNSNNWQYWLMTAVIFMIMVMVCGICSMLDKALEEEENQIGQSVGDEFIDY